MSPGAALLLVAVLIAANGFFVAAEFAMVATRRSAIEERAAAGDRRARVAMGELQRLSFVLSTAQFGITATSLLVGFLAEDAIGEMVLRPVATALGLPETSGRAAGVAAAFLLSTVTQMVLGELAPKNLAIARAEGTTLALARPMHAATVVLGPVVRVFDAAAAWVTRRLGIDVTDELAGGHSLTELSRIITVSGREGTLTSDQAELLLRGVELSDRRVGEVMVPRPDVVWLPADATLEELRQASRDTGHSRFPVTGADTDEVLGTVHVKDLLGHDRAARRRVTIGQVVTPALLVPESASLRELIAAIRGSRRTFAVVVDEFGGIAGIATLEDALEALVGPIEDEFDVGQALIRRRGRDTLVVQGQLRVERLAREAGLALPDGEYETVAGFLIDRLGHIPEGGETVEQDGWRLVVARVDGQRVAEVRLHRPPGAPAAGGSPREGRS